MKDNTNNSPETGGYRYENCIVCKLRYNISRAAIVQSCGYVCPKCEYKIRTGVIKAPKEKGKRKHGKQTDLR